MLLAVEKAHQIALMEQVSLINGQAYSSVPDLDAMMSDSPCTACGFLPFAKESSSIRGDAPCALVMFTLHVALGQRCAPRNVSFLQTKLPSETQDLIHNV